MIHLIKNLIIEEMPCGFEMKCCGIKGHVKNRNDLKDGCKLKCKQCSKQWGKSILPSDEYWDENQPPTRAQGCSSDAKHDMQRID